MARSFRRRWELRAATLLALLSTSAPVCAGDWYVDAVNGNNANSGTSAAAAWRTIGYANGHAPTGATEVIHVAPGTYDTALGESFPIVILGSGSPRVIVGDSGPAGIVVDAGGASRAFIYVSMSVVPPGTRLQGLSIRNAGTGVEFSLAYRPIVAELRDLDVSACATGVSAGGGGFGGLVTTALLEDVRVHDCTVGLAMGNNAQVTVVDSVIEDQLASGVSVGMGTALTMRRVRVAGNGTSGLFCDPGNFMSVSCTIEDCAFTDNGTDGLEFFGDVWALTTISLARCTIAGNAGNGLSVGNSSAALTQCIVFGNADDLVPNGGTTAAFCDIGDGDFAGSNGNFSADPRFVAAASGDYRLAWGSPCIESGDPATPLGTLDLARNARPIDGDLDTLEAFDIGAYEFAPLYTVCTGKLGTQLRFELWGPQGAPTTVYFWRHALMAPFATPYGERELDLAAMHVYRTTTAGAGPPRVIGRMLPNDPAFVGQTFSFQAMTTCGAAPLGSAYTNAYQITLSP